MTSNGTDPDTLHFPHVRLQYRTCISLSYLSLLFSWELEDFPFYCYHYLYHDGSILAFLRCELKRERKDIYISIYLPMSGMRAKIPFHHWE